ncbi:unnamed protein product, partial [marine sediment metagenome]
PTKINTTKIEFKSITLANIPSDSNLSKYMLKLKMPKSEKITITQPKIIEIIPTSNLMRLFSGGLK